ncbi:MAG: hypothetical protein JWR69_2012 [Pedosphaera sp.]|nr:hypothetical protein [Pedosphaera sp.]
MKAWPKSSEDLTAVGAAGSALVAHVAQAMAQFR